MPQAKNGAGNGNGRTTSARTPSGHGVVDFGRLEPKQAAARNGNNNSTNRTPNPKPTAPSREPTRTTRTPAQASKGRWWDDIKPGSNGSDRMVMAAAIHRAGDEIWRPDMDGGASRSRAAKQGATQSRNGTKAQPPAKTPARTPVKGAASKARNGR
jgi:hypothetical protein